VCELAQPACGFSYLDDVVVRIGVVVDVFDGSWVLKAEHVDS